MFEEPVLFVDDDPNILSAYRRVLRKEFKIVTAEGADQAIEEIKRHDTFAVIVSDMQMPGKNGVELLKEVKQLTPDTVRMMLTGNADQQTAMDAVNEGSVFRFVTKPCTPEQFGLMLGAGIEQYRLVTAERELLDKTLKGSIDVLTQVLSLAHPIAFGRADRVKRYVAHMVGELQLSGAWQFEIAAMLSNIGCVTLAPSTLEAIFSGDLVTKKEQEVFDTHPEIGARLIASIPRLEMVARMVEAQSRPFSEFGDVAVPSPEGVVAIGAQMIRIGNDYDALYQLNTDHFHIVDELRKREGAYNPRLVDALKTLDESSEVQYEQRDVELRELMTNMIVKSPIAANNGNLLVAKGTVVTFALIERLRNFNRGVGVVQPISVLIPSRQTAPV